VLRSFSSDFFFLWGLACHFPFVVFLHPTPSPVAEVSLFLFGLFDDVSFAAFPVYFFRSFPRLLVLVLSRKRSLPFLVFLPSLRKSRFCVLLEFFCSFPVPSAAGHSLAFCDPLLLSPNSFFCGFLFTLLVPLPRVLSLMDCPGPLGFSPRPDPLPFSPPPKRPPRFLFPTDGSVLLPTFFFPPWSAFFFFFFCVFRSSTCVPLCLLFCWNSFVFSSFFFSPQTGVSFSDRWSFENLCLQYALFSLLLVFVGHRPPLPKRPSRGSISCENVLIFPFPGSFVSTSFVRAHFAFVQFPVDTCRSISPPFFLILPRPRVGALEVGSFGRFLFFFHYEHVVPPFSSLTVACFARQSLAPEPLPSQPPQVPGFTGKGCRPSAPFEYLMSGLTPFSPQRCSLI